MIPNIKAILINNVSSGALRILKNSYSLIFSQLLRYLINIFISIWIVRYLGVDLFGAFTYITALSGIFGIFSSLGLQSIIVRELVKRPKESEVVLGTSILLSSIAGIIAFIGFVAAVFFLNAGDNLLLHLALISGCTFIFDTLKIFSYHYEAIVQSDKIARINNFTIIVTAILKVVVLYLDLGIYWLLTVFILESVISGLILMLFFAKNVYSPLNLSYSLKEAKSLLNDALPLIMSGFMIGIYMKIDQVMIQNLLGNKEAGIFGVAVRLTEIFYFIPVILLSSLFPGIVSAKDDQYLFGKKMDNLYGILTVFSYCVILIMTLFAEVIIVGLYGASFLGAKLPFMISIWALLFVCLGVARNAFIISHNLNKYYMYTTVIGAVINVACNSVLIPLYGITGASIATILSYCMSAYISSLFFKPLRGQFFSASRAIFMPKINFRLL